MFSFCPHCGGSIDQEQLAGQTVRCRHCGKQIGIVAAPSPMVVEQAEVRTNAAERCPLCRQIVAMTTRDGLRTFVPHFAAAGARTLCRNSAKSLATAPPAPPGPGGKDSAGS